MKKAASAWSRTATISATRIALVSVLSVFSYSCSGGYNLNSADDRAAMEQQINDDLTDGNCPDALNLSTQLYDSQYSDNTARYLYASSQACTMGITFFGMLNSITNSSFSAASFWETTVQLFPSRIGLDTILEAGWLAQDALQSITNPGVVIGTPDQVPINQYNTGTIWPNDRTAESNTLLLMLAMGIIGATQNRYGYTATDDPSAFNYLPDTVAYGAAPFGPFTWITQALVESDSTKVGCALASGVLNLFDGAQSLVNDSSGKISSSLSTIITALSSIVSTAGQTQCATDGFTPTECNYAIARLRWRLACWEEDAAASTAAGIIQAINVSW